MTAYNVHIYRETRFKFEGIEADSPELAAEKAAEMHSDDAAEWEECNGEDLSALVDVVGDDDYLQSRMIDFELGRQIKAFPKLLAACQMVVDRWEHGDLAEAARACADAVEEAGGELKRSSAETSKSESRLAEPLQDSDLDAAHDALSDLLEAEDAANDDILDAAITVCATLDAHYEKRKRALARLRSNVSADRRYFDAEDTDGQKIGTAAEYECGTIRMQLDAAPGDGLIDLVPQ